MDRKEHLYDLLKDFDTAMLVTQSGGQMHARPMAVAEMRPDAEAYFFTNRGSPKVSEIADDSSVMLTFQSSRQFASIYGRVRITRDRALVERLWKESFKVWFPGGKGDPDLVVLQFDAQTGEYWDNSGIAGLKYAFEAAKAYLSDNKPTVDEKVHGKVSL